MGNVLNAICSDMLGYRDWGDFGNHPPKLNLRK